MALEHFDWQLVGVRLKDGSEYLNVFGPPSRENLVDPDTGILEITYASEQILQPDEVDALIFAHDRPWARTLTEEDLTIVSLK